MYNMYSLEYNNLYILVTTLYNRQLEANYSYKKYWNCPETTIYISISIIAR